MDDDIDLILYLEQKYYNEGFHEGQQESTKKQWLEGKEYGYQTGFQRFLIIGYITGLIDYWHHHIDDYDQDALHHHLVQLDKLLLAISFSNNDTDVENYEKLLIKLRNKMRIITNLVKEPWKFKDVDNLVKDVGGMVQLNEHVDDMW